MTPSMATRDRCTVVRGDEAYPRGLTRLPDPPASLRVAGTIPSLERAVAVVGTRAADEDAMAFTRSLSEGLAAQGCVVVSGGAWGIDTAAHEGALEVEGRSVAVVAGGLDHPFPKRNANLFRQLQDRGAVVSEIADDVPPKPFSFLQRNRIIAALSRVVVVVQAPLRSGALSTARHGKALAVPVFAVPAAPWDPRGSGVRRLLKEGARPCDQVRDILEVLEGGKADGAGSPSAPPRCRSAAREADDAADETRLLRLLGSRPCHPQELAARSELPLEQVQGALLGLELAGDIELRPGGCFARTSKR